jgi:glycosyltransferase involved in cell wall biosynthesis
MAFFIAGDGTNAAHLRERLAQMRLDNVHMVGRIAKLAVPTFLSQMDALVIPWHRNPLYRYGVSPNKLFDYMLAAKPILQGSNASNDLVTEAACGVTVEPEDPVALADAARRLSALSAEVRQRIGENGRRFVLANHDCRMLARSFINRTVPASSCKAAAGSAAPQ